MIRVFEILPGLLSWTTLIAVVLLSWQKPSWIAIFIILFDIYWLLKTIYLSFHLRAGFKAMRENLKTDWLNRLQMSTAKAGQTGIKYRDIYHLIILPMYDEPYAVAKESLDSIANTNYPKDRLIIVLATEEKAGSEPQITAKKLITEFSSVFTHFLVTAHPANLPGEIPGKGSNETYAIQEAKSQLVDKLNIPYENILVSVFDVDTQVYPEYFGCLAYNFLNCENPQRSSFQPIPLFINNIHQAPAFARIVSFSSSFWQMMQQARPERLTTFSSHSMPFKALVEIGYWQKDVVSEDSRIFWQCYLHYNGDWRVVPLFYPVSMDANVAPSFWKTFVNIYKQQRRWAWGSENVPYLLTGFLKNKKIPLRSKIYWAFNLIEGGHSWATNVLIIFALGWLPVLIGGGGFGATILSYQLPKITRNIIGLSGIGIASSAILSAVLLPPRPGIRLRQYAWFILQWALMPITLIIFGAIPALDAQTRLLLGGKWRLGFWVTPKSR